MDVKIPRLGRIGGLAIPAAHLLVEIRPYGVEVASTPTDEMHVARGERCRMRGALSRRGRRRGTPGPLSAAKVKGNETGVHLTIKSGMDGSRDRHCVFVCGRKCVEGG